MATLTPAAELSPLQRAFNSFLLSMPSGQLEELLKYLQDAKAHESSQSTKPVRDNRTYVDYPTPDHPASENATCSSTRPSVYSAHAAPKSSASRKRVRDRPLRPLNSFIAFRSESLQP